MTRAVATISARIASNPPTKQSAMATNNRTSAIDGNAVLFRSGQGRCSRPEVAVILAASQRLSVNVNVAKIAAAAGAMVTSALMNCSISPVGTASLELKMRSVQETLELVLDVARDRRLVLLEEAVVVLILLEIVLTFFRLR